MDLLRRAFRTGKRGRESQRRPGGIDFDSAGAAYVFRRNRVDKRIPL